VDGLAIGLFVFSYLAAVIDGIVQDKGTYPSEGGRTGFRLFASQHQWILAGAVAGIAGTVVAVV
jgi:hypothetical protein